MDTISILREYTVNGTLDQIDEKDSQINFGENYSFDKSVSTGYKSNEGKDDFYDLETLVYFAKSLGPNYNYKDYYLAAKQKGIKQIKLIDIKDLVAYLTGKQESSQYILKTVDAQIPTDDIITKRPSVDQTAAPMALDTTAEQTAVRAVLSNERQLRDRNTMLHVPSRSFARVVGALHSVFVDQRKVRKREEALREERHRLKMAREVTAPKPSGRFERETAADAALKQIGAQELGLQQVGFASIPQQSTSIPPPPPRQQQQPSQRPSSAQHRPLSSRTRPPSSASAAPSNPSNISSSAKIPIIMVPPALVALLNMYNAKEFLESGQYGSPQEAQSRGKQRSETYDMIKRSYNRPSPVKYVVTDKEPKKSEDWSRVVAVFCLGKPWQFKTWPFQGANKGDLVATFQKVAGVYMHYADEPLDPSIKKWNVKLLPISRHTRDNDQAVMREFWTHLDGFLKARKSSLAY